MKPERDSHAQVGKSLLARVALAVLIAVVPLVVSGSYSSTVSAAPTEAKGDPKPGKDDERSKDSDKKGDSVEAENADRDVTRVSNQRPTEIRILDTFSGRDEPLAEHKPTQDPSGEGWVIASGVWRIDRGRLQEVSSIDDRFLAVTNPNDIWADVSAEFKNPGYGEFGIVFRYQDEQNYFAALYDQRTLSLIHHSDGVDKRLDRRGFNWKSGETRTLRVVNHGDRIKASVDGRQLADTKSQELSSSAGVGVTYTRNETVEFSRFEFKSPAEFVSAPQIEPPSIDDAILLDNFGDTGSLAGHSPDKSPAGGWSNASGDWRLDGSAAYEATGFDADHRAVIDAGGGNIDVMAELTWNGDISGVVYRYQDEVNWYMTWYDGVNVVTGRNVGGTFHFLRFARFDWGAPGTTRILRVRLFDNGIWVYVDDDDLPISTLVESSLNANTKVGLFSRRASSKFERFAVAAAPTMVVPVLPPVDPPPFEPPAPSTPPGVALYDSFSDFRLTPLQVHEPDAAPAFRSWSEVSGAWVATPIALDEGILTELSGTHVDHRALIDTGVEEGVTELRLRWYEGRGGVVFRYRNEHNWYMFWYDGFGKLFVGRNLGGIFEVVDQTDFEWKDGQEKTLRVEIDGNFAIASVNNRDVFSFDVSDVPASTKIGVFSRNVSNIQIDDFTVFGLGGGPGGIQFDTTTVLLDTFTDVDGTFLIDHTPDLAPPGSHWNDWRIIDFIGGGNWNIESGRANETLGFNTDLRAVIHSVGGDVSVAADVTWTEWGGGLTFRYVDELNWHLVWYDGNELLVGKFVAGSFEVIGRRHLSWGSGVERRLEVVTFGSNIVILLDGTDLIYIEDQSDLVGATGAGLFSRLTSLNTFDNFEVGTVALKD